MEHDLTIHQIPCGPFQTNCYIIHDDDHAVVIDPGFEASRAVESYVVGRGLTITEVLVTHGHLDHTRDSGTLVNKLGIPLHIHQADEFMLKDLKGEFGPINHILGHSTMEQPSEIVHIPVDLDEDHAQAGIGQSATVKTSLGEFTAIGAPGHSPGSVLLTFGTVCFSGDVLFAGSVGRTDLPYSSPETLLASLSQSISPLPDETRVLPGHGPETTIGHEKRTNPFLRSLS